MATKKKITEESIISHYIDYVLEHGKQPSTVYAFAKHAGMNESDFYQFFGSFDAIENGFFERLFASTLQVLDKNEAYQNYDAREKLLSFYFTYFENLTANRSYVLHALKGDKDKLKSLQKLNGLKKHFKTYVKSLNIETLDVKEEKIQKFQDKAIEESAWIQFMITLKFWMDDTSPSFEKTDLLIEKSVNTSFELLNIKPLKNLIDLGKFIFKEKVQTH